MTNTSDQGTAGRHVATVSHQGRFWDVYLEFEDDPRRPDSCRGHLSFSPADGEGSKPVRTATIIIESTLDEALRKANDFTDHQLVALLRSALPNED
jgi:hypothetical protein